MESNLTANASISEPGKEHPAWVPPANVLALASTLIAYPHITSKAKSPDKIKGADAAFSYLKNLAYHVDPLHHGFREAFAFPDVTSRRHHAPSGSPEFDFDQIRGHAANANTIWNRAKDFWHIVGWAFNCSVMHKNRWERWDMWFKVMLPLLEKDWEARCQEAQEVGRKGGDAQEIYMQSLIWRYIHKEGPTKEYDKEPTNRGQQRYIIRAILARGVEEDRTAYKPIWGDNETAGPKLEEPKEKPTVKIDIENDIYGDFDYGNDELMGDAPSSPSKPRRFAARSAKSGPAPEPFPDNLSNSIPLTTEDAIECLGGINAVQYRARLIALIVKVAQAIPERFVNPDGLFEIFAHDMPTLPLMIFNVLISYTDLDGRMQMALNANLLLNLIQMGPSDHVDFASFEPLQHHLEFYLPRRGTTKSYAQNAKVSLIYEKMFLHLLNQNVLVATPTLRQTVEAGIKERLGVWKSAKREEEEVAKSMLEASCERLRALLALLEQMKRKKDGNGGGSDSELSDAPLTDLESGAGVSWHCALERDCARN